MSQSEVHPSVDEPPYTYSWEEWCAHLEKHLDSEEVGTNPEPFLKWFCLQYDDRMEALWKAKRLWLAMKAMNEMLRSYPNDFGDLHAAGGSFDMTSIHILQVFWSLYAGIPDEHVEEYVPTKELVLQMALEAKAKAPPERLGFYFS